MACPLLISFQERPETMRGLTTSLTRVTNGVLQSIHFLDPLRGSFSAVSTPIFATKTAFFSIFQALHFFLCTIPDFSDFSGPLHYFWQNSMQFLLIFLRDSRFCNFSSNFSGFFPEFRRISMISERVMSRFSYFREISEILPKFCKYLMQNCSKSVPQKWIL